MFDPTTITGTQALWAYGLSCVAAFFPVSVWVVHKAGLPGEDFGDAVVAGIVCLFLAAFWPVFCPVSLLAWWMRFVNKHYGPDD